MKRQPKKPQPKDTGERKIDRSSVAYNQGKEFDEIMADVTRVRELEGGTA